MSTPSEKIILPFYCLGSVTWYKKLFQAEEVYFDLNEPFPRQTLRNRYYIATANGLHKLIIPLAHPHSKIPFCDVRISKEEDWQRQHWKTIKSAYGRSPFFEFYADYFQPLYLDKNFETLLDFNTAALETVMRLLKLKTTITHLTPETDISSMTDLRREAENEWPAAGTTATATRYPQVFESTQGFISNASILDLLFCMGPQAQTMLTHKPS